MDKFNIIFYGGIILEIGVVIVFLTGGYILYKQIYNFWKSYAPQETSDVVLNIVFINIVGCLSMFLNIYVLYNVFISTSLPVNILYKSVLNSFIPLALSCGISVIIVLSYWYMTGRKT